MAVHLTLYLTEEFARRGEEIYDRDIRPLMQTDNKGQIVAIDIDTKEYAISNNVLVASRTLQARKPDARIWVVRVGSRAVHRIGPHARTEA